MDAPSLGIIGACSTTPLPVGYSGEALEELFRGTLESFIKADAMARQIHTYAALLRQIRNDLRIQHPEWIQQNGESPMCDSYEARLTELLFASMPVESNDNIAFPDRELSKR